VASPSTACGYLAILKNNEVV
jgi:hypothetical protein